MVMSSVEALYPDVGGKRSSKESVVRLCKKELVNKRMRRIGKDGVSILANSPSYRYSVIKRDLVFVVCMANHYYSGCMTTNFMFF